MNLPDRLKDIGIIPFDPNEKKTIYISESKLMILDQVLRNSQKADVGNGSMYVNSARSAVANQFTCK